LVVDITAPTSLAGLTLDLPDAQDSGLSNADNTTSISSPVITLSSLNGKAMVASATVTVTSWIKEVDIVNAGLDIVMLTSLNEGTPVSLIEAQAANRPIISTRVGGIENVVIPGGTALLSESGDREGLRAHLSRLVQDASLRQRLGMGGWEHVQQRYHYTRLVSDMAELYKGLLH
jgi:glycosyltransferase involved in cell wall biosynthesis